MTEKEKIDLLAPKVEQWWMEKFDVDERMVLVEFTGEDVCRFIALFLIEHNVDELYYHGAL